MWVQCDGGVLAPSGFNLGYNALGNQQPPEPSQASGLPCPRPTPKKNKKTRARRANVDFFFKGGRTL